MHAIVSEPESASVSGRGISHGQDRLGLDLLLRLAPFDDGIPRPMIADCGVTPVTRGIDEKPSTATLVLSGKHGRLVNVPETTATGTETERGTGSARMTATKAKWWSVLLAAGARLEA